MQIVNLVMVCEGHKEALVVKFADSGAKKKLQQRQWLESTPIVSTTFYLRPPAKRRGRSGSVVYLYVCNTITFKSIDVGSSFSLGRYISRGYALSYT